ncbi:MAG: phosphatidate cytidylyltransferase [Candidatus Aminicenantes bacterium]|nr:phosphatidate cytidylyltransferase [Candidatus Aminicenantes bacterium]
MNTKKRLPTAIFLLIIVFLSIQYASRLVFFIILQGIILVSLIEFYNLSERKNLMPKKAVGVFFALLISLPFYIESISISLVFFAVLMAMTVYYIITVNKVEKVVFFPASVSVTFFGAFYLSFTLNHFNLLREEKGPFYIYFLLAVIFIGDTGAFYIGKLWGRRKLVPMASPNKTWEGSLAGIITACLGGIAAQQILFHDISLWKAVVFAFLIHAVAQVSDPFESLFKRAAGVKDSSNILPGHGGFLDRVDSLILATPLFYYLLQLFKTIE